jgi:hypothetical protein
MAPPNSAELQMKRLSRTVVSVLSPPLKMAPPLPAKWRLPKSKPVAELPEKVQPLTVSGPPSAMAPPLEAVLPDRVL